jgi:D-lactate dehydrogenase
MKIAVFSTKPYDQTFLETTNTAMGESHRLTFFEPRLTAETATLAQGHDTVCAFVNDVLDRSALQTLHAGGIRLIAMRCAGFNNVDLQATKELGIGVVRVPAYSPYAVAEHAVGLMLTLNRKFYRAYNRVRDGNFALDGLLGFDMHGKTVGVVGTGKIGICTIRILLGFGCRVLTYDPFPNPELDTLDVEKVELDTLFEQSDIVTLHCPLTPENKHLINAQTLAKMKHGVMLINTSRGGLIRTVDAIEALKSGQLGALGVDVYEDEQRWFFEDYSGQVVDDDVLMRLLSFPNVVVTGHQAFFTREALTNIARTTIDNITEWEQTGTSKNAVS